MLGSQTYQSRSPWTAWPGQRPGASAAPDSPGPADPFNWWSATALGLSVAALARSVRGRSLVHGRLEVEGQLGLSPNGW